MNADRDARSGRSFLLGFPSASLMTDRAALHSRDTPRCTAAGHVIVVLASPRLDSRRGPNAKRANARSFRENWKSRKK
jgi:hypothetical protein